MPSCLTILESSCWLFLANLLLGELYVSVSRDREKAKLQSILLNFMVVEEKVKGNLILLSKMQLYIHDYSIHLCPA